MSDEKLGRNPSFINIGVLANTKQLCRVLSHKGPLEILYALQERPKQFKELFAELNLASSTFEDALTDLYNSTFVIKKNPITSKNRETHQYALTQSGKELMKFIQTYEKIIKIPQSQQKIINNNIKQ